jgi:2-isopropylmalate synthase
MQPESVGVAQSQLVLGKHSGRHGFSARLNELGFDLEGDALNRAFKQFKVLADRKKTVTNADLEALVASEITHTEEFYSMDGLQVACGTMGMPTATVRLTGPDGAIHEQAAIGTGPVDAAFKAIDTIVRSGCRLLEYTVQAVTEGIDALGEVNVRIQGDTDPEARINAQGSVRRANVFHGHGTDTDIIVASARAYLAAVNRMLAVRDVTAAHRSKDRAGVGA